MDQPLTAKALAHLPSYIPLQSFFLEQYYPNTPYPQNAKKSNSSSISNQSNSTTNSFISNPNHGHGMSQQHQQHLAATAASPSLISSGYSSNGSNQIGQQGQQQAGLQNQQFSSMLPTSHHSHNQSHHSLQQLASQLQSSSSTSSLSQQHQMLMMEMLSPSESSEEGNQQNALSQFAHCQQFTQLKKMEQKYKTELCKNWVSKGTCQYGQKCRFAHGKEELIERLAMNKNYKTKLCTAYHKERVCQYAARCHFKHDERTISEIRYQHFYQKHIASLDDESILQFQFGLVTKRMPFFKQLQGLQLTEEDEIINTMDVESQENNYSCPTTAAQQQASLSQMMMLMLNGGDSNNHISLNQQSSSASSNSPFYMMNYPSNDQAGNLQSNFPPLSNFHNLSNQSSGNFFMPSNASYGKGNNNNNSNSAKHAIQDKDLSMISNANTADTSESISHFSLADKYNSIPSTEKLFSTNLFF